MAAGMSVDAIADAIEAMEGAGSADSRTARQQRNARYYEKTKRLKASEKRLKTSEQDASEKRLKASESVLNSDGLARVRDNPSRLVISGGTVVDVSASAPDQPDDWPEANPVDALVAAVGSPRLDPAKSPGLVLTAGRLAAWRRDGASWKFDVVPVVSTACAKTKTPVASWKYFDAAIAQSIADNRRALEIPEARQATGPPGQTFAERLSAENAEARRRAFEILDQRAARNG